MRISFLELLNANLKDPSKGIDLFGVCDFCAKHNIEAVDLTGYFFPGYPKAPAESYVNRMKRHTHDRGHGHQRHGRAQRFCHGGQGGACGGRAIDQGVDRSRRPSGRPGHPRLRRSAAAAQETGR